MKEVKRWLEKAEEDLERSSRCLANKDFEDCAFHAHQAAEKALKALYILKFKRLWKIHDLKELSQKLKASPAIIETCKKLNPHYIETRYPTEIIYTQSVGEDAFKNARIVVEWVKKKLRK